MQKTLFSKHFITIVSIILLSIIILGAVLLAFASQYFKQDRYRLLLHNAQQAAQFTYRDFRANDYQGISTDIIPMYALLANAIDADIYLVNTGGKALVFQQPESTRSNMLVPKEILETTFANNGYQEYGKMGGIYSNRHYTVGIPIANDQGQPAAVIFASASGDALSYFLGEILKMFVVGAMTVLILAFAAVYFITGDLVRPLRKMVTATQSFSKGDFSIRVPVESCDEIGQLAISINNMASSLASLESVRRSFTANVSHELRTPMTTIGGFIDGILDGTIPEEKRNQYLEIVSQEIKRLSRLVRSMLNIARIETILKQDETYVWGGDAACLSDDVNLLPSRYLITSVLPKTTSEEKLFKLADLISVVPLVRDRSITKTDIPLIGMRELSSSYLNCDINRKDIPISNKTEYRILSTDSLLIGFIGGKFKVGRVHGVSEDAPIALRHEVFAIQLNSNVITEDYLLRCIMSAETELQAKRMSSGVTISRISQQDILSISIIVPNLISQQENQCKEDTRSSLTESDRKLLESAETFRRDIHMKKHAIGQAIFNLNNWMKVLQRARRDGNGIVDDNATVGTVHKTKVSDIYANLQAIMQELQIKINKLDSGYGMQSSEIALVDFIEKYIHKNQSPIFQYVFDNLAHRASQSLYDEERDIILEKGDALELVQFPLEALTIIFDNIISNACCHGFKDTANQKNMVKIDILSEGEDYIVTISNNGAPLLTGYNTENVLTYGVSSKEGEGHYGIGGYEVRKLMREFGGDAELISNPNDDFCITYRLIFKSTNIIASFS